MRHPLALLPVVFGLTAPHIASSQPTFLVRNVRVFDGERVSTGRSVLVQDGKIAQVGGAEVTVPAGTEIIDGNGRTLLPGLIDAHVHQSDTVTANLRQASSLGVTTVLDMYSNGDRFERVKAARAADAPNVADVRTAGRGATAPGGHPSQMGGPGPPFPTIANASEASAFVDARIAEGSDYIKIIYDDLATLGMKLPTLDEPTLRALVTAAHARGKLAVVHALSPNHGRIAIESGADGLVHFFANDTLPPNFAELMARRGAFIITTLSVLYRGCGRETDLNILADTMLAPYIRPALRPMLSRSSSEKAAVTCSGPREALRQLVAHSVAILAGTDSPVPGLTYGATLHGELALLVRLGLTPVQALTAATSAPARAFGLADRGRISPGLRADLVLVDGDPTIDILASRRIVMLWKRGIRVERLRYGN